MRVRVRNGNVEQALRSLKRKINDSGKLYDYKEKERYSSKSEKKQRKKHQQSHESENEGKHWQRSLFP